VLESSFEHLDKNRCGDFDYEYDASKGSMIIRQNRNTGFNDIGAGEKVWVSIILDSTQPSYYDYFGFYDAEKDCVEIEVPILNSEYRYGYVEIWAEEEPLINSKVLIGERTRMWYQKLLDTDENWRLFNTETLEELITSGEIQVSSLCLFLWKILTNSGTYAINCWRLLYVIAALLFFFSLFDEKNDLYII